VYVEKGVDKLIMNQGNSDHYTLTEKWPRSWKTTDNSLLITKAIIHTTFKLNKYQMVVGNHLYFQFETLKVAVYAWRPMYRYFALFRYTLGIALTHCLHLCRMAGWVWTAALSPGSSLLRLSRGRGLLSGMGK
jgi:hypothetical protein